MRPEQNDIISQHVTSVCMVTAAFFAMSLVFATLKTLVCSYSTCYENQPGPQEFGKLRHY